MIRDGSERAVPQAPGPLTVAQVVRSDGFAGVERYICQLSNGLAARGHRVVVIGGDPTRMRSELVGGVDHLAATTVARTARALVARRGVDVVHAHMTAAETAAWLAHPVQRVPIVATRHFADDRGSSAPARLVARVVARSIAVDIAISRFVADTVTGPSVLIPNGVPDRQQAPLAAPTVVMLQRLTEEKAPELGLEAWARSGLAARHWRLVVAGRGDRLDSLVAAADRLGVTGSVEFAGLVADTDGLLAGSSIVLATAPREPFGLSVVEAMAHGVPVVAAAGGAHLETVATAGMLFPAGDAAAAARALVELASSRTRRLEVGAALRRRQQTHYSLGDHVTRLEQVYAEVTSGLPVSPG